jgi:GDP-4-dehydro-6-deoxy-D-mannose reductase
MTSAERVLITGIQGFSGRHLCAYLLRNGCAVSGLDLTPEPPAPGVTVHVGDLRDPDSVDRVLRTVRPACIVHLAALTTRQAPLEALHEVNVRGTVHLFESVRRAELDPVVVLASSSAVYGLVRAEELPISERQPFRPVDGYAVSKIAQEMLSYTYWVRYGLRVVRTRAFNLVGPGQPSTLACSSFARQIAEIEAGRAAPVLRVGRLTAQRDFVDVRDAVEAYWLLAQRGEPGEVYNVCSEQASPIETCLTLLLGMARVPIAVEQDPARMQPVDVPVSVGDGGLLYGRTGWRPRISLAKSLADLLAGWRERIGEV